MKTWLKAMAGGAVAIPLFAGTGIGPAFAAGSPGGSDDTRGANSAASGCESAYVNQTDMGVAAGGGPKEGIDGPANCDQYYLDKDIIGADGG